MSVHVEGSSLGNPVQTATQKKQNYFNDCTGRKIEGFILLVLASVALAFALVLAAGVFGGGDMNFVAGGLVIGSMVLFGLGTYLLLTKPKKASDISKSTL